MSRLAARRAAAIGRPAMVQRLAVFRGFAVVLRIAWHPMTIAGCLGALAVGGSLVAGPVLAWPALGLTAGFATSGSV